ncbi:MAG: UDP-N-acetylmuramoyl-L-alanyl-D-glutamate--2,6-diaminopimelate ligase [Acidobacteriota bacterium]|jgi:UDP-N-acetylmuramoyl-L-alanyl-D-glutamate--2,6-diaminopimelate ligase|nr:UDP-N-acetylmuramoyl-L-alanyl-D-glutamate--2,6-diaminopimelate ligase [Acidobacteriota bacterium]
MKLLQMLQGVRVLEHVGGNPEIHGLRYDSRRVTPGDCFVAVHGFKRDGLDFLDQALADGAAAVVTEHAPRTGLPPVAWVRVADDRAALSRMAANLLGSEAGGVRMIGVTGTNGKTTVAGLIAAILSRIAPTGLAGTLGMTLHGVEVTPFPNSSRLTTPESVDLFEFAAQVASRGGRYMVMEASSAAIALKRVADIPFSLGVFTTFSGDHLDFHHSMDAYFRAKLSLFQNLGPEDWAVINIDDPAAGRIVPELQCHYLTYGFSPGADITPRDARFSLRGMRAVIRTPLGEAQVESPLLGRVNLLNIMAAMAAALVLKIPLEEVIAAVAAWQPPRGRLEPVHRGEFAVVVDFAHTDRALHQLLSSLREVSNGKLILVFGAGGDRDSTKRPRMGQVAAEWADFLFVTSDNPRSEDPGAIAAAITSGFPPEFSRFKLELDRRKAINAALNMAGKGDTVVITGKGHETSQIIGDRVLDFNDAGVVREWLSQRGLVEA